MPRVLEKSEIIQFNRVRSILNKGNCQLYLSSCDLREKQASTPASEQPLEWRLFSMTSPKRSNMFTFGNNDKR